MALHFLSPLHCLKVSKFLWGLATNILLVIGTFAIALKIAPIALIYQEKNLCIKYLKHQIDRDELIKRLKIVKQANPSSICDSILKS